MEYEEQHRMGREADSVLRLGMMLAGAGSSGYRVIRAMKRAARALGFDRVDAVVGVTRITCTFHRGEAFRTSVALAHHPAVDASRIEALETLSHNMHRHITVEELNEELDRIEDLVKHRWSPLVLSIAAAVACAGFAVLNHFNAQEVAIVAVSAGCGQAVRGFLARNSVHQLGGVAMSGSVAALMFYFIAQVLDLLGVSSMESIAAGYVASVLFLVPGFPLFSSIIDLSRFDFDAGLARLTYSLTIIFTATFAVAMISWVTGLNPHPADETPPGMLWFPMAAAASFFGVAGFAFIFNSSRRMVLLAASLGLVANVCRLLCVHFGVTPYIAAFIGGTIIGVIGSMVSRRAHIPRATVTVPASVIMIPGAAMFRMVYHLNTGDMDLALTNCATSSMAVTSIAAGLILARMLTDHDWTFGHLIEFNKPLEGDDVHRV